MRSIEIVDDDLEAVLQRLAEICVTMFIVRKS
jgi:hypothetical protein